MKPTCTSRRPAAASASMMARQARSVVARGFSQKTGLPAAMPASTYSSWVGPQEATRTASTSWSAITWCAAGVHDGVLQPGGDLLRQVGIEVGDGGDLRAREHVGDPADVVLADHAGAHDSDSNCHAIPFRYGQRRTGPSPQAV
jgi:hypothetical protein